MKKLELNQMESLSGSGKAAYAAGAYCAAAFIGAGLLSAATFGFGGLLAGAFLITTCGPAAAAAAISES